MSGGRYSLRSLLPPRLWPEQYGSRDIGSDISAGLTVGVMLIPQGMAWALIAGLPPVYGLYSGFIPLIGYALFGTSRDLSVGPTAMVSLLVFYSVSEVATGPEEFLQLAVLLALLAGVIQLLLGLVRLGFIANFLSNPVLSGFTSAAAVIIGFSQVRHLLGVDLPESKSVFGITWSAVQHAGDIQLLTVLVGVAGIVLLLLLRNWKRWFPGQLTVLILATAAVWFFGLHTSGMNIVGSVPDGLPSFALPRLGLEGLDVLIPAAITIAFVGFVESIAIAKAVATRKKYELDANQELVALGIANIAGSFFQSFPTTGSISRSAVNAQAGSRSKISSLVAAVLIGLTLLFLTPLFYYMPLVILASIVMVAVAGLIDVKEAVFLWRVKRQDFFLMLLTFLATLLIGIKEGIIVGVVLSLVLVIHRSSTSRPVIMGQLPGTSQFRNLARHPEAVTRAGVLVVRVDASLYFANVSYLKDSIRNIMFSGSSLKAIVLDAYPLNSIDSTAAHGLMELILELERTGVRMFFGGVKGPVMETLRRSGLVEHIGEDRFSLTVQSAAAEAERYAREGSEELPDKNNPLDTDSAAVFEGKMDLP
jgi:SulP family sulfate permease